MHTINQSLAATILRLMRSAQLAHFLLALGATDFASIDARILLGNARGQVDLPLHAKGFRLFSASRSLPSTSWKIWRICGSDEFTRAEGRMLVARPDFGRCPQDWQTPGAPRRFS